jgi:hypothetical protein
VYDALEWEEVLKRAVTDSKGTQHDTINEVEQGRSLFTQEAYSKHSTETASGMISLDKEKIVDSIVSTGAPVHISITALTNLPCFGEVISGELYFSSRIPPAPYPH